MRCCTISPTRWTPTPARRCGSSRRTTASRSTSPTRRTPTTASSRASASAGRSSATRSGSSRATSRSSARSTAPSRSGPTARPGPSAEDYRSNYLTTNVTAQLGPQWRIRAAYNLSNKKYEGRLPALDGTGNPTANYAENDLNPELGGVRDDRLHAEQQGVHEPARRVLVQRRLHRGRLRRGPGAYFGSSVGVPGVPAEWQKLSGYPNVTTNSASTRNKQKRFQVQYDTTFFFSGGGEHQLKAGVQLDRHRPRPAHGRAGQPGPDLLEPVALRLARPPTAATRCAATARSRSRGSSPRAT